MQKILRLCALLLLATMPGMANANSPANMLSLLDQPITEARNSTIAMAEVLWGSQASCQTIRTGVGMTRRAYFLETCVFSNKQGNTLYDELPTAVSYRFLEDQLVQVTFDFEHVSDPARFQRCVQKYAKKLDKQQGDVDDTDKQTIAVTEQFQVTVSHEHMVNQIHVLRDAP